MEKNKKGLIPLIAALGTLGTTVLVVLVIGVFLLLLFGGVGIFKLLTLKNILIFVGAAIAILATVYSLKGNVNSEKRKLAVLFLFVGVGLAVIAAFGIQQEILGVSTYDIMGDTQKLVITATPNSENILVSLSRDDLNKKLESQGLQVKDGVRIELTTEEFKERYSLIKIPSDTYVNYINSNAGNTFKTFTGTGRDTLIRECRIDRNLPSTVDAYADIYGGGLVPDLHCIYPQTIGAKANIDGQGTDEFKVKVNANGEIKYITRQQQYVELQNGYIKITFITNLAAPEYIKSVPFDILFKDSKFQYLIQKDSIAAQNTLVNNYKQCIINAPALASSSNSVAANEKCINNYNNGMTNILKNRNSEFAPSVVNNLNFDTIDANHGELEATLVAQKLPLIKIEVDGKLIGIEKINGKPEIVSCANDIDTTSGRTDELVTSFKFKNAISASGTPIFYISISCNNPNIDAIAVSQIGVAGGSTETIPITVTGISEIQGKTEKATCVIMVTDKNSQQKATCSFNANIKYAETTCQPGIKMCSTDKSKILKCNSNGDNWDIINTCSLNDCKLIGGDLKCESEDNICIKDADCNEGKRCVDGQCIIDDITCQEKAEKYPFLGYEVITTTTKATFLSKTLKIISFGSAGQWSDTETSECKATFLPYYIIALVITAITIVAVVMFRTPKRRKRR